MFKIKTTLKIHDLKFNVNEINFKTYKSFNKLLFLASKIDVFTENIQNLIVYHTNLTEQQVRSFNLIEILIILLEIRALSLGNTINILVDATKEKDPNSKEHTEKKYTSYNKSVYALQADLQYVLSTEHFTFDEFKIKLKSPTLEECGLQKLHTHHFVDWVEYKGVKTVFEGNKKDEIFDDLPFLVHDTLLTKINTYIKQFEEIKLVDVEGFDENTKNTTITLSFDYEFIVHIVKLMFSNNLMTLHENLYRMSQFANMDLNYIDTCAPGEVFLYMKLLEADINEKNGKNA